MTAVASVNMDAPVDPKVTFVALDPVAAICAASLKLQSQHVWPVLVSNLAISAIVAFVLWPLADRMVLIIWTALVWALTLVRFFG